MSDPYIGEIRMFGGSFAPVGWAFCDGQQLPISEFDALFTLIGTTYGGDGQETFLLPDLQGRVPMHAGNGFNLAEKSGVETVTLTTQQLPVHSHPMVASQNTGTLPDPGNHIVARSHTANVDLYLEDVPTSNMATTAITPVGGSQPHENMQPFLVVSFIFSLYGIYPQQN